MGLNSSSKVHKQNNFFLFFPMYVCLGIYYILEFIALPFVNLYNKFADNLYLSVNSTNKNEQMTSIDMFDTPSGEGTEEKTNIDEPKKNVKISSNLVKEREALINSIDANEEIRNQEPLVYQYIALSPDGKKEVNTFIAYSKVEVYTFLENEGYKVFKIQEKEYLTKLYKNGVITNKIKTKDIVFWLEQLSTYLKSGIPLTEAMRILSKQMGKNKKIKRVFNSVVYYLTLGENFSNCLERQGDAFPALLINMIRSAEATGDLEGTLDEMADYYRATETTKKEMISAMTYPSLVFIFSIGVIIFILVYLVPQFVDIYKTAGVRLNPITSAIIGMSDFLKANLFYIIVFLVVFIIILVIMYKNLKAFRYSMQTFMMKLPIIGKVIIYKEMMIFTKTFSSLLRNNVFITDSMSILSKITNNEIYKEIMANTLNYIGRGEKISLAFKNNWAVPDVAYYMMQTGESTGELAEMMGKVSDYYSEQHKLIVDSLKTLIEPMLIIFLAVVVGGIMIAVIVPMFGLYSEIL